MIWISFLISTVITIVIGYFIYALGTLCGDRISTTKMIDTAEILSGVLWSLISVAYSMVFLEVAYGPQFLKVVPQPQSSIPILAIAVYVFSLGIRSTIRQVVSRGLPPTFRRWRNEWIGWWIILNTVTIVAALVLSSKLTTMFQVPGFSSFMLSSVLIAMGQGKVMQYSLRQGWKWFLFTSFGLVVGVQSGFLLGGMIFTFTYLNLSQWLWLFNGLIGLISGAWIGAVTGVAQYFVLAQKSRHRWRWIPISAGSWGIGLMISFSLSQLLSTLGNYLGAASVAGFEMIGLVIGLLVASTMTGIGFLSFLTEGLN